jgi:DNA-binding FadR family transcriptional regulator
MLKPIPSGQIHTLIQERLKDYLLRSGLRPNDQLPSEYELSNKLGTSRSAVREALRSLEAIGMIEVRRGKGRYLRPFNFASFTENLAYSLVLDATSIHDLLEVRRSLEVSFLPQAASALTRADITSLRTILRRMRSKAEAGKPFVAEDMEFHQLLFSRVSNDLLKKLLEVFWSLFKEVHGKGILPAGETTKTVEYHEQIVDAIEANELELAESLLREHFVDVQNRLVRASSLMGTGEEVKS